MISFLYVYLKNSFICYDNINGRSNRISKRMGKSERVYYIKNKEIIKAKANATYYKKKYESLKNGPKVKGTILDFVVKTEENK